MMSDESYNDREIEPKWRQDWISKQAGRGEGWRSRPKYYSLDMVSVSVGELMFRRFESEW